MLQNAINASKQQRPVANAGLRVFDLFCHTTPSAMRNAVAKKKKNSKDKLAGQGFGCSFRLEFKARTTRDRVRARKETRLKFPRERVDQQSSWVHCISCMVFKAACNRKSNN